MVSPYLPEEILIDIFSRLPAKSVGKMRCLSKSWCALLSTTQFIKLHLTRTAQQEHLIFIDPSHFLYANTAPIKDDTVSRNIELPNTWTRVAGSCNGLVLLENDMNQMFVVNPTTLEQVRIPDSPLEVSESFTVYGFGYDCSTDDYKIITFTCYDLEQDPIDTFVEVYSMKMGVWKMINNYSHDIPDTLFGAFVNKAIHWLALGSEPDFRPSIMAFDLVNEIFYDIPCPANVHGELFVLGECLCMVNTEISPTSNFWVMKEYGLAESWTKFSIDVDHECYIEKPLCFIGNEEILWLTEEGTLVVYNMKEKMVFVGVPDFFKDVGTFVESLISPVMEVI